MAIIKLSINNVEVIVPKELATKELYASSIIGSNLSPKDQEALLKEAGLFDFVTGGLIPESDFKNLWAKEQQPGGVFTDRIINLKEAAEKGRLDAGLLIQGLEALAQSGSAKAQSLAPKYKMILDSWMRGNKAAEKEAQQIISTLTSEFQKLVKTTPLNFLGVRRLDKSKSKYPPR